MAFRKKQKRLPIEFNSSKKSEEHKFNDKSKTNKSKFNIFNKPKKSKRSIFRMIVFTSSALLVVSLLLSTLIGFTITKDRVEKDFTASAKQLLIQNKNYVDFLSEVVETTSLQLLSDRTLVNDLTVPNDGSYEAFEKSRSRQTKINNLTSLGASSIISSVAVYNEYGNSVTSVSSSNITDEKLTEAKTNDWYKEAKAAGGKSIWVPLHRDTLLSANDDRQYISNVRVLNSDLGREAGILKINMTLDRLQEKVGSSTLGESGYIKVLDKNGFVITSKNEVTAGDRESETLLKLASENIGKSFNYTLEGVRMLIMCEVSETTGWTFLALIPEKELYASATSIGKTNAAIAALFLLLAIFITTLLSRMISKPLQGMVNSTRALAEGDFSVALAESSIAEVDELAHNFNTMVLELKDILQATKSLSAESTDAAIKLQEISQTLKDASEATTETVNTIADGSFKQTEEVSYCVDFTKQFNEEIGHTIDHISAIQNTTDTTLTIIEEKSKVITELKKSSSENKETIEMVAATIDKLGDNTKDILTILKNINDITDRTNLLSLNAAIEAARAGEAGKGFAVVADEVRKLADQSKQSAEEIKKIIGNIQTAIQESVNITKKATLNFEGEYEKVDNTIEAFNIIKNSFGSILKMVEESSGSISKLEKDKETLIKSIDSISSISQDNSAATEEVSATMEEQAASNSEVFILATNLTEKSKELNSVVEKFKL